MESLVEKSGKMWRNSGCEEIHQDGRGYWEGLFRLVHRQSSHPFQDEIQGAVLRWRGDKLLTQQSSMDRTDSAHVLRKTPPCFYSARGNEPCREETQHPRLYGEELDVGQDTEQLEHLPFG